MRYFYKSNKGDSTHTYAVYKDSKTGDVRAIPTAHLNVPDEKIWKTGIGGCCAK